MKTIILNPLDPDSIRAAAKAVREYEEERKKLCDLYIQRLAEEGCRIAQDIFGSYAKVTTTKLQDGWEIRAEGEQVVFLEFGTGTKTTDHELSGPLPIEIVSGSWSEGQEGKGTWQEWIQTGRVNGKPYTNYPYDTRPKAGMWEAYKAIVAAQDRIAQEVFGK